MKKISLAETKPVLLVTFQQEDHCWLTLWKNTPENRFQGGKSIYWLQSHNPIKSGWATKQIGIEEVEKIWKKHGWKGRKICAPSYQPVQSRDGLLEVEPNVFTEAC